MAREGKRSKKRNSNFKNPDPTSKRSRKRANRGFKSLEVSSRKHRRCEERSLQKRTIGGKVIQPGEKILPPTGTSRKLQVFLCTGGGSRKYH